MDTCITDDILHKALVIVALIAVWGACMTLIVAPEALIWFVKHFTAWPDDEPDVKP